MLSNKALLTLVKHGLFRSPDSSGTHDHHFAIQSAAKTILNFLPSNVVSKPVFLGYSTLSPAAISTGMISPVAVARGARDTLARAAGARRAARAGCAVRGSEGGWGAGEDGRGRAGEGEGGRGVAGEGGGGRGRAGEGGGGGREGGGGGKRAVPAILPLPTATTSPWLESSSSVAARAMPELVSVAASASLTSSRSLRGR